MSSRPHDLISHVLTHLFPTHVPSILPKHCFSASVSLTRRWQLYLIVRSRAHNIGRRSCRGAAPCWKRPTCRVFCWVWCNCISFRYMNLRTIYMYVFSLGRSVSSFQHCIGVSARLPQDTTAEIVYLPASVLRISMLSCWRTTSE